MAELFPGHFALVMATGIIAVDALQQRVVWLVRTLLAFASIHAAAAAGGTGVEALRGFLPAAGPPSVGSTIPP